MPPSQLTVFHFTDPHARIDAVDLPMPRLPGAAATRLGIQPPRIHAGLTTVGDLLAQQVRATQGPVMLLCCGDVFGREVPHDRIHRGAFTARALALLADEVPDGQAVWVLGNHDVDHGLDRALALAEDTGMLLVSANTEVSAAPDDDAEPLSALYEVIPVGTLRVALVAVTTPQVSEDAQAGDRQRLTSRPPVDVARAGISAAVEARDRGEVDLVMAVAHCFDEDDAAIASLGPDLVIGGHTHGFADGLVSGTYRAKAGSHGRALGRVVLRNRSAWEVDSTSSGLLVPLAQARESALLALAREAEATAEPADALEPICSGARIGDTQELRSAGPSPLGNAVANGLLAGARTERPEVHCAVVNAGNIRSDLVPRYGSLRRGAFRNVLAFENQLVVVSGPPSVLLRTLATAVACLKLDRAGWLRVSGVSARVTADGAIEDVVILGPAGSVPLHELSEIHIATLDWLALEGGNHYGALQEAESTILGDAAFLWTEALTRMAIPRVDTALLGGLEVDPAFRQTNPVVVVDTLEQQLPGSVAWARARLGASS